MIRKSLYYVFHSGHNSKLKYYVSAYLKLFFPRCLLNRRLKVELGKIDKRSDREEILRRVDYYNQLSPETAFDQKLWKEKAVSIKEQPVTSQKVYFLDYMEYARFFSPSLCACLRPGDITDVPNLPSIVKSRPIGGENRNSVLLNMDKVRHFVFVKDKKQFSEKKNMAVFRGIIGKNEGMCYVRQNRYDFVDKFFDHPKLNVGAVDDVYPQWNRGKMTLAEHLDYKFVVSLEGNDVASNLKWVMSSNSIAVMPKPRFETWFMEGKLIPDYHYILIKDDYSDLIEKMEYFSVHVDEAREIIDHAHRFVAQFMDPGREKLVSLLVLNKYFEQTGQYDSRSTADNDSAEMNPSTGCCK